MNKLNFVILCVFSLACLNLFAQSKSEKIQQLVDYYESENLFNGSILVAEKGKIIHQSAVGMANFEWKVPNTTQTKFRLGSITKQFTSMLIMQLVKEGKIDLNKPITTYLTNYRKETGDSITVHHLLTHSSGIPNYTDNDAFYKISKLPFSVADFIRLYCSGDPEFTPGSRFSYSNSGYFILGAIIEAVTKKTYAEALKERILLPLGMVNTGYDDSEELIPNRAAGYERTLEGYKNASYLDMGLPYSAGSLYSTVEDLFTWNEALYTEKLLPASYRQKLFDGFLTVTVPSDEILFSPADKDSVASGWFVKNFHARDTTQWKKMIWHSGGINGFLTELARFPEDGNFIVILDNTGGATESILREVMAILYDLPLPERKKGFANLLQQKIVNGSVKEAYDFYTSLDSIAKLQFNYKGAEQQINRWGYQLLNDKKDIAGAMMLFEINTKQFPRSFNVYDSYGEALAKAGQSQKALINYKKAVELRPSHARNVQHIIAGLEGKVDTIHVMVDGHQMTMYKSGSKGPVVVLEAGGNGNHTNWNSIVPELAKTMTVITYDRPGFLASEPCAYPRTANRVADELKQALTKAGIKGPYVLGGWSWGGFFVRAFAAKYPAETKGLLLVDPAQSKTYLQMAIQQPDEYVKSFREIENWSQTGMDEISAMLSSMQQAELSDKKYKGKIELLIAGSYRDWKDAEKPSKKIWIDELVKWAKANPSVRYQIVDAGHAIHFEKPEVVIAALSRLTH